MSWTSHNPSTSTSTINTNTNTNSSSILHAMAAHSASLSRDPPIPLPIPVPSSRDDVDDSSASSSRRESDADNDLGPETPFLPISYAGPLARAKRRHSQYIVISTVGPVVVFVLFLFVSYFGISVFLPDKVSGGTWGLPEIESAADGDSGTGGVDAAIPSLPDIIDIVPESDGTFALDDPAHVLVPILDPLPPSPSLLLPVDSRLPLDVLAAFYTNGRLLDSARDMAHPLPQVDLVYLWVNATSPYFASAKESKAQIEGITSLRGKDRHWRDNGELRGSVRSGALALDNRVRTVHIVSAAYDFDLDAEGERERLPDGVDLEGNAVAGWRMGQVASWLNWSHKANLRWHFHPEIFRLPRDDNGELPEGIRDVDEGAWQARSLPTFNSFEIETRVGWLEDLSEQFIMSNDDMFMLRSMATTDFHHPLLGPVVRLDMGLMVKPIVTDKQLSDSGEWGGLQHASLLISTRFPDRPRAYMHHMPKALTRSIAHEASVMFATSLTESATRGFRESRRGIADVEMAWLMTHLRIERWREALLWSWAVARVGAVDGIWGEDAREEVRKVFKLENGAEIDVVTVHRGKRSTLDDMHSIMRKAGWEEPKNTAYVFSSFDGHLPARPDAKDEPLSCSFSTAQCFPDDFFTSTTPYPAQEIFATLAFAKPGCGDCLIQALVTASGNRGLDAFLPLSDAPVYYPPTPRATKRRRGGATTTRSQHQPMWRRDEPMLPLVPNWVDADFSVQANVHAGQDAWAGADAREDGGVDLRNWCIKLLSRYTYVYSSSPSRFAMVHNVLQLHSTLKDLDSHDDIALVCINDDQPDSAAHQVRLSWQQWMERKFGSQSRWVRWERDDWNWSMRK